MLQLISSTNGVKRKLEVEGIRNKGKKHSKKNNIKLRAVIRHWITEKEELNNKIMNLKRKLHRIKI
jgi:hypothetical protein